MHQRLEYKHRWENASAFNSSIQNFCYSTDFNNTQHSHQNHWANHNKCL